MGPADRDPGTASRALLSEIRLQRELRDEAFDAAERPRASWLDNGELARHAQGAHDGLEGLVLTALAEATPPTHEELAEASGLPVDYVAGLQDRLVAAVEAGPAPRRRWFRRG